MTEQKSLYCPHLWNNLVVFLDGKVAPCCMMDAVCDFGQAAENSLLSIFQSSKLEEIRQLQRDNKWSKYCVSCRQFEEAGVKSKRQYDLEVLGRDPYQVKLTSLELRLESVCNLACRTCNPSNSSAWILDAALLGSGGKNKLQRSYPNAQAVINDLEPIVKDLQSLRFVGGEPFLSPIVMTVMDWINQFAPHLFVEFITNFSGPIQLEKQLARLSNMKQISLAASLDGVLGRAEYIRHGLKWSDVENNLRVLEKATNTSFCIAYTVSIFNILHLIDCIEYWGQQSLNPRLIINFSAGANDYHNIQALPREVKKAVDEKYQEYLQAIKSTPGYSLTQSILQSVLSFMWEKDLSSSFALFSKIGPALDQLRGQSFGQSFPELVALGLCYK